MNISPFSFMCSLVEKPLNVDIVSLFVWDGLHP